MRFKSKWPLSKWHVHIQLILSPEILGNLHKFNLKCIVVCCIKRCCWAAVVVGAKWKWNEYTREWKTCSCSTLSIIYVKMSIDIWKYILKIEWQWIVEVYCWCHLFSFPSLPLILMLLATTTYAIYNFFAIFISSDNFP